MGCIRSKPIHRQDENETGYVFDGLGESQNTGFKLDIDDENTSFGRIGDGDAVAAFDLGAGRTESCADDNTKEKSVDDYALAKRMQLLRDIAELQMEQLRMARHRFHRSIIQSDSRRVVQALQRSQSEDILGDGEKSSTDDYATEKETKSTDKSPAKKVAIWLLDVVLDNIDFDGGEEKGEECESDDEDSNVPDSGNFQFRRSVKSRMTIRRHIRLPPSSSIDIGSEMEKHLSKSLKSSPANINASTTDVLLLIPEGPPKPNTEIDVDQPIENQRTLLDDQNNLNALDQVHSHDLTTDLKPTQSNDEESSIDEDREKRRLQWLANRKSNIPSVRVEQELHSDAQPREIDIDKVIARKKFPWMRQV